MQSKNAVKVGILALLIVLSSLASVMYALAYTEKSEVVYDGTITLKGQEVKFRAFYLDSPTVLFEVKM
ncbi:MAG: hypothetical protein WC325_07050, partial [Candidatus Bathyarchaeia archaeon]